MKKAILFILETLADLQPNHRAKIEALVAELNAEAAAAAAPEPSAKPEVRAKK